MDVAALPIRLRQHFDDRTLKPWMIVADREDHSPQAASFQPQKELFPAGGIVPIGHFHAEDPTPAFPIDSDSHQHGPRTDHSVLAQLLITRINNQIGILTLELAPGKPPKFGIQLLIDLPLIALALKLCPQSSLLIACTFRVETPWMYIWVSAATSAFSLR
jgi:hypothetical protein